MMNLLGGRMAILRPKETDRTLWAMVMVASSLKLSVWVSRCIDLRG
jgi:hypothetical protein